MAACGGHETIIRKPEDQAGSTTASLCVPEQVTTSLCLISSPPTEVLEAFLEAPRGIDLEHVPLTCSSLVKHRHEAVDPCCGYSSDCSWLLRRWKVLGKLHTYTLRQSWPLKCLRASDGAWFWSLKCTIIKCHLLPKHLLLETVKAQVKVNLQNGQYGIKILDSQGSYCPLTTLVCSSN